MEQKTKFAILRIAFGLVWAVDAFFKWQPEFFSKFTDYLTGGAEGQPMLVQNWIHLWTNVVGVDPHFFALIVAIAETALALGLIFGIFTELACYGGITLSLVIWSTAEGFGGPYVAGSTDIGAAIIYVFVFIALLFGHCWEDLSIDSFIKRKRS